MPKDWVHKKEAVDGSTLEGKAKSAKRGRTEATVTFAKALLDIQMAIVTEGYPTTLISGKQGDLIEVALPKALDEALSAMPEENNAPRFSGINL